MNWYKTAQQATPNQRHTWMPEGEEEDQMPEGEDQNKNPELTRQEIITGPDMSRISPSKRDQMLESLYYKWPRLFKILAHIVGVRAVEPLPIKDRMRHP